MRSFYKFTLLFTGAVWLLLAVGCARSHEKARKNQSETSAQTAQVKTEEKTRKTASKAKSTKLGFYEVSDTHDANVQRLCIKDNKCPPGVKAVRRKDGGEALLVKSRGIILLRDFKEVVAGFRPGGNTPVLNFALMESGAKKFCRYTATHAQKRLAIVLDNKLVSAPTIITPICGGRGYIEGLWTMQEAQNLADSLNAGIRRAKERVVP